LGILATIVLHPAHVGIDVVHRRHGVEAVRLWHGRTRLKRQRRGGRSRPRQLQKGASLHGFVSRSPELLAASHSSKRQILSGTSSNRFCCQFPWWRSILVWLLRPTGAPTHRADPAHARPIGWPSRSIRKFAQEDGPRTGNCSGGARDKGSIRGCSSPNDQSMLAANARSNPIGQAEPANPRSWSELCCVARPSLPTRGSQPLQS